VQGGNILCRGRAEWRLLHLTEAGLPLALSCPTRQLAHLRWGRVHPHDSHLGQGDLIRASVDSQYSIFITGAPGPVLTRELEFELRNPGRDYMGIRDLSEGYINKCSKR
jgi:hypothetical protein